MTVILFESDHDRSKSPAAPLSQETAKSSFDQIFKDVGDSMATGSQDQGSGTSALFDDTSSSLYDTTKNMDIFEGFVSSAGATLQTSPMWTSSSMMATLPSPAESSSSSSPPSSMDLVSKFSPNYASTLTMNYTMSSILLDTFGSTDNQSSAITSASTTNINTTMDPMDIFLISTINMNDGVTNNGSILLDEQMERNIYIMPLYQQIIWTIIFGTMVFVSTGGNLIVIWIVLTNKRMRTVTNYFLVNLSVADIMVSTLNVIFSFIYMLNSDWPFGELLCKVTQFTAILSVAASVFTLMAISIDRYLAIVHPLRPRMSRTTTVNIIVVIWITSSLLSLPNIICATTFVEEFKNGDSRVVCYLEWWDGMSTKSRIEYIYNVIILLVTYVLPIASMSYTYFCVGCELWGSQSIGECQTARQMENIKSKRKIVKMMMIVVAIFGLCWAPYHIYFLLAHHYQQIIDSEYVQHTYLAIYWLAMSNSVYNPFVYCWLNSRFRQGFRQVLCCLCNRERINGTTRPFEHSRYHGAARYSCASEHTICITDTRVRFNGNGNITLHSTANNNNENSNNNNTTNTNKKNKITISDSHTNQPQRLMADKNHPIKRMVMMKNNNKNNNNNNNSNNNNNNNRNIGSSPATTTATTPSTTTTMASTNSTTTGSNISPLQSKLKFPQKEML